MRRFLGKEVRKYAVMIELWTNAAGTADSVFLRPPRLLPKLAGLIVTPFLPDCSRDASEIDPRAFDSFHGFLMEGPLILI